jgi:excinuclease ABC subunit C
VNRAKIENKLKELPKVPGVYFHKNARGEIIYIGKAANLRNRVRQYFHPSTALRARKSDAKTEALVSEIVDVDWMVVDSELEALFLEAEMIRRYMPRYNILLRDDKSMAYIRIDYASDFPTVTTTRRPLDDDARYFGPYLSSLSVRQALKFLRRIFPFATRRIPGQKRATLHYHLGLDPGLEEGKTSLEDYRANLRKLMAIIEGRRKSIERELERDMKRFAKRSRFEEAAKARNQLFALKRLNQQVIFSDKEFLDISKDHALNELTELLSLYEGRPQSLYVDAGADFSTSSVVNRTNGTVRGQRSRKSSSSAASTGSVASSAEHSTVELRRLRRIEGYDISHTSGTDVVASMVVFTNGVSDKVHYRKFKTKLNKNDDFYNMHETISRRLSETNIKKWGQPDLVLIDGGKGQLDAAIRARTEAFVQAVQGRSLHSLNNLNNIPFIGLAKREEQLVIRKGTDKGGKGSGVEVNYDTLHKLGGFAEESKEFILINLPKNTNLVKLLQRIRDESHRFAVSYHSVLKTKRQTASLLDDIPTIGPATRKKLLRTFGSVRGLVQARDWEVQKVVGEKKAAILKQYLRAYRKENTSG